MKTNVSCSQVKMVCVAHILAYQVVTITVTVYRDTNDSIVNELLKAACVGLW
jgi:hypothetical protein